MRIGGVLPFFYETEPGGSGMTALAGLPPYLDLARAAQLRGSIERNIHLRENGQGWTPAQLVMQAVLLNLAGGDCVDFRGGPGYVFGRSLVAGATPALTKALWELVGEGGGK